MILMEIKFLSRKAYLASLKFLLIKMGKKYKKSIPAKSHKIMQSKLIGGLIGITKDNELKILTGTENLSKLINENVIKINPENYK